MSDINALRAALAQIAELAARASRQPGGEAEPHVETEGVAICTPKSLPPQLHQKAARTAVDQNPMNAPFLTAPPHDEALAAAIANPQAIVVLTQKYWGASRRTLTVSFMDRVSEEMRRRVLSHMNAWQCAIKFVATSGTGQVRISFGSGGFWSYLGTDILHISTNRQTMNLEAFTMNTPESEFHRVIRHETGHTLGFPHEHMRRELVARIDPQKAYPFFLRTQGWNKAMVDAQVLTALDDHAIFGTPADQTSIMCYQLPGEITRDGKPIIGGIDINPTDLAFCQRIYPLVGASAKAMTAAVGASAGVYTADADSEFVEEPVLTD